MTVLAQDSFTRTVVDGWGVADTGQAWSLLSGLATSLSVNGAEGVFAHTSASRNVAALLGMTPSVDLDVTITWSLDAIPTGGVAGPRLYARHVDASNDYHARILAAADTGAITVGLYRGDSTIITAPIASGVSLGAGVKVKSRVQAIGSSPTTLKAKVWLDGTTEPDWQVVGTDSTAAMQVAGRAAVRIGLAGGTTVPLTSRVDNFLATDGTAVDPATGKIGARVPTSVTHDSITIGVDRIGGTVVEIAAKLGATEVDRETVTIDAASGWGNATFAGLTPNETYGFDFYVDGVLQTDTAALIQLNPTPGTPTSFTYLAGSCQFTGSNHPVWDAMLAEGARGLGHMGDQNYGDATTVAAWRGFAETSFMAPRFRALLGSLPMTWTWDNHDRIIADDGGGGLPLNYGRTDPATNTEWRRLAGADGWASADTAGRTWVIGRVRFIQTDQWTMKDDPDAGVATPPLTFLGAAQKAWFKATLEAATEEVIVWLCQWTGQNYTNGRWGSYPDETAELEAFIDARPAVKAKMVMIGGDSHSLQVTDGSRTFAQGQRFAGIPNYNISGFNRSTDAPTGNPGWLVDEALRTSAQPEADWGGYSRITVTDDGSALTLLWEGVRVGPTGTTDIMASQTLVFGGAAGPVFIEWDGTTETVLTAIKWDGTAEAMLTVDEVP